MKKALKVAKWLVPVLLLIVILIAVQKYARNVDCNTVFVTINSDNEDGFITDDEVRKLIQEQCDSLQSHAKLDVMEHALLNHPAIKSCQVYESVSGKLYVNVQQRVPLARVMSLTDDAYYIDDEGKKMPIIPGRPARVPILSGSVNQEGRDSITQLRLMSDLYQMLQFIHQDEFWNAAIEQIHVTNHREFILIPKVGLHEVHFGGVENLEGKFKKLLLFYQKGLTKEGWKEYKVINVKYKNQVVCQKNNF